ncbi:hypothetical protein HUU05_14595 [candidate division KSB1 bacterium]|nr:hypothetical protein [candidate division KSB1 bacterium]
MSTFAFVAKTVRQNFLFKLYKHYILDSVLIVKRAGFKELIRQRGLKFFYAICAYYLVRDTLLYVVLPYFVARGLF